MNGDLTISRLIRKKCHDGLVMSAMYVMWEDGVYLPD